MYMMYVLCFACITLLVIVTPGKDKLAKMMLIGEAKNMVADRYTPPRNSGFVFFLLSIFLNHEGLFRAFFMESTPIYAGFVFFGMLYTPIELILSVFLQMLSRRNEYQADNYAATTIASPENMINALKKLSKDNLTNLTPHPFLVFMSYSHPPIVQQIHAIRAAV